MSAQQPSTARLEAIAGTVLLMEGRTADVAQMIGACDDLPELAHALMGLAGSLLHMLPADVRARVIMGLRLAALRSDPE